jgi:hypothetical protein
MFVASAASASLSADVASKSGQGSAQYAETAATVSRGHTIQLLRDALYRACEAYMNGAVDEADYRSLLTFYDLTMITTLSIEGITQPKIPGSVTIGTSTPEKPANAQASSGAGSKSASDATKPSGSDGSADASGGTSNAPKADASGTASSTAGDQSADSPRHSSGAAAGSATDSATAAQATEMLKAYFDAKLKLFDKVHQAAIEKLQLQMKNK